MIINKGLIGQLCTVHKQLLLLLLFFYQVNVVDKVVRDVGEVKKRRADLRRHALRRKNLRRRGVRNSTTVKKPIDKEVAVLSSFTLYL